MDIDDLVRKSIDSNQVASSFYERLLREAHNKYSNLSSFELQCHERRITQEVRLFGSSFRAAASLHIIKSLIAERSSL